MPTPDTLIGPDGLPYAVRLTHDDVHGITGYFHWIPAGRGHLSAYVSSHFPGWEPNEFAKAFTKSGVLRRPEGGGLPRPHKWLVAIWISHDLEWCVESTRLYRPVVSSRKA